MWRAHIFTREIQARRRVNLNYLTSDAARDSRERGQTAAGMDRVMSVHDNHFIRHQAFCGEVLNLQRHG